MKWLILVLISILSNELLAEFNCQYSENCTCSNGIRGDYELMCPKGLESPKLIAQIFPGKSVQIQCSETNSWEVLNSLYGIEIGPVSSFVLRYCPFPTISFKELLNNLKIPTINALGVLMRGNFSISGLTRKHLEGLKDITKLYLNTNSLRDLPEDLFHDTTNITWLDLKNNHITLPKNIFRHIPKLEVLELGSNNLSYLEPGIFKNLAKLRLLNLWSNRLKNLSRALFSDIPNLENLDINSNGLTNLPPDIFADLIKLKTINLSANNFKSLPQGLFLSNPKLESVLINHNRVDLVTLPARFLANLKQIMTISIQNCKLVNLTEDFIAGSTSLINLTLEKNLLVTLSKDFFKDNNKLENINLSNNKLNFLPDGLFQSTSQLKILNLANNALLSLTEKIFDTLNNLEVLNLSFNEIMHINSRTFVGANNLKTINLSNNKIQDLQLYYPGFDSPPHSILKDSSATLEALYLSHNNISEIYQDWLMSMTHLQILDLSYNNLPNLSYAALTSVVASKLTMDLSYNDINYIDFDIAEELAKNKFELNQTMNDFDIGVRVVLKGNPLICDCRSYDLVHYFRNQLAPQVRSVVRFDGSELNCAGNNNMKGMLVSSIDPELLTCEENDQCPYNCSCYYRPYDNALLVDCSERGFESLPSYMPNNINRTKHYDHIELDVSHNRLEVIPSKLGTNYDMVTKIDLSYNNIRKLSLASFSKNLTDINLGNNNMTIMDTASINILKNLTSLENLTLTNNPWNCDCEAKSFITFISKILKQVTNYNNLTCRTGEPLITKVNNVCPTASEYIGIVSIVLGVSGLLIGLIVTAYYRYQREIKVWLYAHRMCLWFVTEEELDKDKQYDAFVSYSSQDENFVVDKLVPGLENGPTKYKLCLHYRDWIVGDFIPNQIARSVEDSRRTIVVLSPNFLESVWGRMEFRAAHSQALSEGRARVIVILYGDIGPTENLDPELKAYLSMNTYVKWGDPWFWDKLRYALPHPTELSKGIPLISHPKRTNHNEKLINVTDSIINTSLTTPPADSKIDNIIIDTKPT